MIFSFGTQKGKGGIQEKLKLLPKGVKPVAVVVECGTISMPCD